MAGDPRLATDYQTWLWVPLDEVYPWLLSKVEAWKAHRWDADVALPERALFLVGERGVGKTWLLRHLAKDEPQVSALAAYLDLEERAYFSSAERYVEVMNDRVEQQLGDEGAVLLVDAVPPQMDEKLRMLEDSVLRPRATQRHALVIMALTHPIAGLLAHACFPGGGTVATRSLWVWADTPTTAAAKEGRSDCERGQA